MSEHVRVKHLCLRLFSVSLASILAWSMPCYAQGAPGPIGPAPEPIASVRFEVLPVANGAELLTLFFQQQPEALSPLVEVPLISILRDTLGSPDPEVHLLRYLWVHTSATPSFRQRLAAAVPFMYHRIGNAGTGKNRVPTAVMDLSDRDDRILRSIGEIAFKASTLDPRVAVLDSVFRQYGRNRAAYIQTQFARASIALDMEDPESDLKILSAAERRQLQARLAQRNKTLARLLNDDQLERFYVKEMLAMRQDCARNWELLRQRAESEGLYFEPLLLPDGTATHVLLLASREDLRKDRSTRFDDRFLSIRKPWGDKALLNWTGAVETRYFDAENRPVSAETSGAKRVDLIPLALYGLDHPRIPALLIDFREPLNAKRRELSAEAAREFGARVSLGSSPLNVLLGIGRTVAGVVSRRTGVDLFQPSRALSYAQLKMVLSGNPGLSDGMLAEIARRAETVAVNPLENDVSTEIALARNQYQALLEYARRPDGLRIELDRDRRAELTATAHGGDARLFFRVSHLATFGLYTHKERQRTDIEPMLYAQRRRMDNAEFLRDVVKSGTHMDVEWDLRKVRDALSALAAGKTSSDKDLAETTFSVFNHSRDFQTRQLCLDTLRELDTESARKQLLRIAQDPALDMKWRVESASYLGIPIGPQAAVSPGVDAND